MEIGPFLIANAVLGIGICAIMFLVLWYRGWK